MAKIVHVRDVPDDVHAALTRAARTEGLSLTRYLHRELASLARRQEVAAQNAATIRQVQDQVGSPVGREEILAAVREGRGD